MAKSKTHSAHPPGAQAFASVAQIKSHIASLDRRIEQVQGLIQDGVPYLDALKVKVEFGVKETIRDIFGQQSKEFQVLRTHTIDITSPATISRTLSILQGLIAYLEEQQQVLLGKRKPSSKSALEFCTQPEAPHPEHVPATGTSSLASAPSPSPPQPLTPAEAIGGIPPNPPAPRDGASPATSPEDSFHANGTKGGGSSHTEPRSHTAVPLPGESSSSQTARGVETPKTAEDLSRPLSEAPQLHPTAREPQQPTRSPATGKERLETTMQSNTTNEPTTLNPKVLQASSPAPPAANQTGRPSSAEAPTPSQGRDSSDPLGLIRKICMRFHPVIRQLRERSEDRLPYEIEDEHDVRDVLRALLYLEFDDVATEEWTPASDQGGVQRDFLVQPGGIVIFVTRTKSGLGVKEISDRWATACQRYASHQDCKMLFGFIYDPEGRIPNPRRVESDLAAKGEGGNVEIQIFPK